MDQPNVKGKIFNNLQLIGFSHYFLNSVHNEPVFQIHCEIFFKNAIGR